MSVVMGNDEFILFIRKQRPACNLLNPELGKRIWIWISENDPGVRIVHEDADCYWGNIGAFVSESRLPKTAAQISFDENLLPRLYRYLQTF